MKIENKITTKKIDVIINPKEPSALFSFLSLRLPREISNIKTKNKTQLIKIRMPNPSEAALQLISEMQLIIKKK